MRFRTTTNRQHGNPLFAQGHSEPWVVRHPRLSVMLLLFMGVGVLYGIYAAPYWQLKNVELQGTYTLPVQELRALSIRQMQGRWLLFLRQNTLWAFDTDAYEKRLRERWIFSSLDIQRKMPDTLVVRVTEEKPSFRYSDGVTTFGINQLGVVSTIVSAPLEQTLSLEFASPPNNVVIGTQILSKSDAEFIGHWQRSLSARNIPTLVPSAIQLSLPPDVTARLRVVGEWDIVVDRSQKAQPQIDAFFSAYEQKLQGQKLEYVDVTVPARVYYK